MSTGLECLFRWSVIFVLWPWNVKVMRSTLLLQQMVSYAHPQRRSTFMHKVSSFLAPWMSFLNVDILFWSWDVAVWSSITFKILNRMNRKLTCIHIWMHCEGFKFCDCIWKYSLLVLTILSVPNDTFSFTYLCITIRQFVCHCDQAISFEKVCVSQFQLKTFY